MAMPPLLALFLLLLILVCQHGGGSLATATPAETSMAGGLECSRLSNNPVPFPPPVPERFQWEMYFSELNPKPGVDIPTHVPFVEQVGSRTFRLVVRHAMDAPGTVDAAGHYIHTLFATDQEGTLYGPYELDPEVDTRATAMINLPLGHTATSLTPWSLCNLHNGWVGEPVAVVPEACWNATIDDGLCVHADDSQGGGNVLSTLLVGPGRSISIRVFRDELEVQFTLPTDTWMGLGVGTEMTAADIMLVRRKPGDSGNMEYRCDDMYVRSKDKGPELDVDLDGDEGRTDTKLLSATALGDGAVVVKCSRPLTGTGFGDRSIDVNGQSFIYAYGKTVDLRRHAFDGRAIQTVDLSAGAVSSANTCNERHDFIVIHGVLMAVLWSVLVPFGAAIVRYQKHTVWWLGAHRFIQSAGSLTTIPTVVLAFRFVGEGDHIRTTHAKLGIMITVFSSTQAALGIMLVGLSKLAKSQMDFMLRDHKLRADVRVFLFREVFLAHKDWVHSRDDTMAKADEGSRTEIMASEERFIATLPWRRRLQARIMPYKHRYVNPIHRYVGRALVVVAFVQLHLGADLLQATPLIQDALQVWTYCFVAFCAFKELELQLNLPHGFMAKASLVYGLCRRDSGGNIQREPSQQGGATNAIVKSNRNIKNDDENDQNDDKAADPENAEDDEVYVDVDFDDDDENLHTADGDETEQGPRPETGRARPRLNPRRVSAGHRLKELGQRGLPSRSHALIGEDDNAIELLMASVEADVAMKARYSALEREVSELRGMLNQVSRESQSALQVASNMVSARDLATKAKAPSVVNVVQE